MIVVWTAGEIIARSVIGLFLIKNVEMFHAFRKVISQNMEKQE